VIWFMAPDGVRFSGSLSDVINLSVSLKDSIT
jgi:hypothetical protein